MVYRGLRFMREGLVRELKEISIEEVNFRV